MVIRKGARLSVQPVTKGEFDIVSKLGRRKPDDLDATRRNLAQPVEPSASCLRSRTSARFSTSCGATATLSPSTCRSTPNQEAAEIHRRVIAAGGPALLFTNVRGRAFPLVTNLFGTATARGTGLRHASARAHQSHRAASSRR